MAVPIADGVTARRTLRSPLPAVPGHGDRSDRQPVDSAIALLGIRAMVELADACGLLRLPGGVLSPMKAGSTGVGQALLAAPPAPGIDRVLEFADSAGKLERADLVVTGEGSLDAQTVEGKGPAGMAAAALGRPVVAEAGWDTKRRYSVLGDEHEVLLDQLQLRSAAFTATHALPDIEFNPAVCTGAAGPPLERLGRTVAAELPA